MVVTGLLDKLLLTALCALLLVQWRGAVTAPIVALMLIVVCYAAITEWLFTATRFTIAAAVAQCFALVCSCVLPMVGFALPVIAFDMARFAGRSRNGNDCSPTKPQHPDSRMRQFLISPISRYLWLVPSCWTLLSRPDMRIFCTVIMLLSTMAFLWGSMAYRQGLATSQLRRTQDERRSSVRALRQQLSDAHEDRMEATHTALLSERTRIARDIHDNVGHLLTRAIMQTQAARVLADARHDDVSAQAFADIHVTLDEAMTMMRRSVHDLDDSGVDFAAWIEQATRSTGRLHVVVHNSIVDAPAPVARCFSAIIRESLSNAARHSMATETTVTLQDFPAFWQLVVQDNGGNDDEQLSAKRARDFRGMGLADMESRVRALDGIWSAGHYGIGWRVFVSIPKASWYAKDHDAMTQQGETT
ncbi:two-component system sensor histidine kinase [Bifidobacterium sp. DSM 109957]|uniref:histidine kinase n=2 Tax=Bifidobacterium oedipodis TaxID=2675322 RepID=A0A7Y0EMW6_9BIFI|nr:two-component system sensor histidine kinase [Bifidobacterium sp. DSM 109957]